MIIPAIIFLIVCVLILLRRLWSVQILWFFRPDCGFCHKMSDEWNKLEQQSVIAVFYPFITKKIDINDVENQDLAKNYNVQGVPFIVKVDLNGSRDVYDGERSYAAMLKWAQA